MGQRKTRWSPDELALTTELRSGGLIADGASTSFVTHSFKLSWIHSFLAFLVFLRLVKPFEGKLGAWC